jgi:hypothetical protein
MISTCNCDGVGAGCSNSDSYAGSQGGRISLVLEVSSLLNSHLLEPATTWQSGRVGLATTLPPWLRMLKISCRAVEWTGKSH